VASRGVTSFETAARPFGLAAAAMLVFLMLFTTYAVLGRQLFDLAVLGVVELSELVLVALIFIALPGAFLRDENIVVDVIDQVVSKRASRVLYLFGLALTVVFLAATAIAMIEPAMLKYRGTQYTMVLEIDRFYHWMPILFGMFVSIAAAGWLFVHRLRGGGPPVPPREIE
jgi:TRAP-type C4-dicarboxylate transport system permease small subunit